MPRRRRPVKANPEALLRESFFGDHASAAWSLMCRMTEAYAREDAHSAASTSTLGDEHDAELEGYSKEVRALLAEAASAGMHAAVGHGDKYAARDAVFPWYATDDTGTRFRWHELMVMGGFNRVHKGLWRPAGAPEGHPDDRCVVKISTLEDVDLRVFFQELVLHELLRRVAPAVVRDSLSVILQPFILNRPAGQYPPAQYGMVMAQLGEDLDELLHGEKDISDRMMLRMLAQVCNVLVHLQRAVRFQHRDLKPDNLMTVPNPTGARAVVTIDVPAEGSKAAVHLELQDVKHRWVLIDFGMACFRLGDGTYVGSDSYFGQHEEYSPIQDLVFLLACLMLDDEPLLRARAPVFHAMVCEMLAGNVLDTLREHRDMWGDDASESGTSAGGSSADGGRPSDERGRRSAAPTPRRRGSRATPHRRSSAMSGTSGPSDSSGGSRRTSFASDDSDSMVMLYELSRDPRCGHKAHPMWVLRHMQEMAEGKHGPRPRSLLGPNKRSYVHTR